jgi:hypothetical protein
MDSELTGAGTREVTFTQTIWGWRECLWSRRSAVRHAQVYVWHGCRDERLGASQRSGQTELSQSVIASW